MHLSEDQIAAFEANGFLALNNVFSQDEVLTWRQSAEALQARAAGLTESTDRFRLQTWDDDILQLQQVAEPHELGTIWMDLARDPRILDAVESLIGPNIQLYYSMFMMKLPWHGFEAPWHQDMAFFPHNQASQIACQVYVDDSTVENGCIRVVPGSHKEGLVNHYKDGEFTARVQVDTARYDQAEVIVPVNAGGMLFWHSLTLHRSDPNTSEHPRRAIVFEYKNPEARLLGGGFRRQLEVRPIGMMVRGEDPHGELLPAV